MACSSCQKAGKADPSPSPVILQGEATLENTLARPSSHFIPPMYRFRDTEEEPNTFEDQNLDLLLARIVQFRFENKLPEVAYLKDVVLNYTMMSDESYFPFIEYYMPDHQVHLSAMQYMKSALAFAKAALVYTEAELFVSQDEAERRALICINCPRNVQYINGHDANSPTLGQSRFCSLAKGRTSSADGALGVCGVCTCVNRCKIHFNKQFVRDSATPQLLGQFDQQYVGRNGKTHTCWISDKDTTENG